MLVLVLLPLYAAIFMACSMPEKPSWVARFPQATGVSLTSLDRILAIVFCGLDFAVSAALLVSLGLLIATWVPRLGRAVAVSVIVYFLIGIGWFMLIEIVFRPFLVGVSPEMAHRYRLLETCARSFSPVFGPLNPIIVLEHYSDTGRAPLWNGIAIVILTKAAFVAALLWLTIRIFDRCMGRVEESRVRKRAPRSAIPRSWRPTQREEEVVSGTNR